MPNTNYITTPFQLQKAALCGELNICMVTHKGTL